MVLSFLFNMQNKEFTPANGKLQGKTNNMPSMVNMSGKRRPPAARWGHLETLWRMHEGNHDAIATGAFA